MANIRDLLHRRVLVADGAMGTMIQAANPTLADFGDLDGCNEMLNLTRPDIVADVHRAYLEAGSSCIETNTFGANFSALNEYSIADRIAELAGAGARIARTVADEYTTSTHPRFVLGSIGPGTKLATLGHIDFATLRDAYHAQTAAMIAGGIDAVQIETCQDLLQAKAAVIGAKRAIGVSGKDIPVFVSVTVETTGTMLAGSEIGAALATLRPLGIDLIGLNCATGPAEMGEHLRYLSRHSPVKLSCMPNAGLPVLTDQGAVYPLSAGEMAEWIARYCRDYGLSLVGGCCGTTPDHIRALVECLDGSAVTHLDVAAPNAVSSLYSDVVLNQETSYLSIGERTNVNGSKAFREAMLDGRTNDCVDIARDQIKDGAHLLDLCVDYVGRDCVADMASLAATFNTAVTLPIVLDSTEPAVIEAGLEHLAGRCVINSVNFEDGDGPGSRFSQMMPLVKEHGAAVVALTIDEEGQARTTQRKVAVAERLIRTLVDEWGLDYRDILLDCLTFPVATGQDETRNDGVATLAAIAEIKKRFPEVGTVLGVSNISFGLNPAARQVLNSVFLHEAVKAGLDAAIVHPSRIVPMDRIEDEHRQVALDVLYNRKTDSYDPVTRFLELFEGVTTASVKAQRQAELAGLPVAQRLQRRIVDAFDKGMEDDLDEALSSRDALNIINTDLLDGMKTVGDLFGSGQMQLPFVLASAEVMKKAVAYLEPHIPADQRDLGKGTIVIATVKGDVHDIGKNLVDIILTNNGYTVINLGIKQPISAIIEAAEAHQADMIGMSGLLVKSTLVMRDNLAELNDRGLANKYPVMLGGAALTRTFVEQDLQEMYQGTVRYAKDAFEGLAVVDALISVKRGLAGAELPPRRQRVVPEVSSPIKGVPAADIPARSDVERGHDVPTPPFWGNRVITGVPLADIVKWIDERALFLARWGLKATREGPSVDELIETQARPRLRRLLSMIQTSNIANFGVVYGYWPVYSQGQTLHVLDPDDLGSELASFEFPRQKRDRFLCIADFFRDRDEFTKFGPDVLALQLVTMGSSASKATSALFERDRYRDYLELHGLSVQLTEALAELWHSRIRHELGIDDAEGTIGDIVTRQHYQGERYSFGYPACPNLEDRAKLVRLVEADRIGVTLSEEFQLHPEQSTDALVVHHREAKYFSTS